MSSTRSQQPVVTAASVKKLFDQLVAYEIHAPASDAELAHARRMIDVCASWLSIKVENERPSWRCFHCDAYFTDASEAREHFGRNEYGKAACQIAADDLKELRRLQGEVLDLRQDNDRLENDSRLWHESEADRIRRIGNVQWWQELDSKEGERLALAEENERLMKACYQDQHLLLLLEAEVDRLKAGKQHFGHWFCVHCQRFQDFNQGPNIDTGGTGFNCPECLATTWAHLSQFDKIETVAASLTADREEEKS